MIDNFEIPQRKETVQLDSLLQHEKHKYYYGENEPVPETLLNSINDHGIIDIPIVNPNREVLVGWRRIQALKEMGKKSTVVYILEPPDEYKQRLENAEEQIIVDSNQFRVKSWLSIAKEIQFLNSLLDNRPGRPRRKINLNIKNGLGEAYTTIENDNSPEEEDESGNKGRKRAILSEKFGINEKYIDFFVKAKLDDPDIIGLLQSATDGRLTIKGAIDWIEKRDEESPSSEDLSIINDVIELNTDENFQLYNRSCTDLSMIGDNSVNLIVTSPPYGDLRKYSKGIIGDLGNMDINGQDLDNAYEKIFKELYRVAKDSSNFYLNVGDLHKKGLLCEFPDKLKRIAQGCEFKLVNTIIFHKIIAKPMNAKKINKPSFEYIFHFVKDVHKYVFIPFKIGSGMPRIFKRPIEYRKKIGSRQEFYINPGYTNLCDTWKGDNLISGIGSYENLFEQYKINADDNIKHSAEFPEVIPLIAILQGSKEGDVVLDPFSGSGKAGEIALKLFRKYIGVELNPKYYAASIKVLKKVVEERNIKFRKRKRRKG